MEVQFNGQACRSQPASSCADDRPHWRGWGHDDGAHPGPLHGHPRGGGGGDRPPSAPSSKIPAGLVPAQRSIDSPCSAVAARRAAGVIAGAFCSEAGGSGLRNGRGWRWASPSPQPPVQPGASWEPPGSVLRAGPRGLLPWLNATSAEVGFVRGGGALVPRSSFSIARRWRARCRHRLPGLSLSAVGGGLHLGLGHLDRALPPADRGRPAGPAGRPPGQRPARPRAAHRPARELVFPGRSSSTAEYSRWRSARGRRSVVGLEMGWTPASEDSSPRPPGPGRVA